MDAFNPNWREDPRHYRQKLRNINRALWKFERVAHAHIHNERKVDKAIGNLALETVSSPTSCSRD